MHVIFGVSFEITPQLVQIETVLVAAALTIQEKLAKFTRAETGPNHPIIQHELVHGENGDCRLSSVVKCEVGWVAGAAPRRIVDIIRIDHNLL